MKSEDYAKSTWFCIYLAKKKKQRLDGGPGLIAQFSKCDFWNLGDFLNRNMWSKKNRRKKNWSKKISIKHRKKKISRPKKNPKKINEKLKF